jgi:hypothetical protein
MPEWEAEHADEGQPFQPWPSLSNDPQLYLDHWAIYDITDEWIVFTNVYTAWGQQGHHEYIRFRLAASQPQQGGTHHA